MFLCRGCDIGGSGAIDLKIFVSGCSFPQAIEALTGERMLAGMWDGDQERFDLHLRCADMGAFHSIRGKDQVDIRESTPSTALRHKIMLSNLWKFARGFAEFKRNGKTNPTADAINLYTVEQEHEPWPDDVQDRFTAACDKNLYLAYHLLLCTGQRVSDVVNMKWADYNSTHFKLTQIKTNTEMWIKAPKILRELLAKTDRVHENILTHKWGKPYTRDSLGHRIKDVLIDNGDGRYTTHGLRKNAGILLAENGATVPQIMAALGHTTPKLALYYCRLAQQRLLNDQAVAIMDDVFERRVADKAARVAARRSAIRRVR